MQAEVNDEYRLQSYKIGTIFKNIFSDDDSFIQESAQKIKAVAAYYHFDTGNLEIFYIYSIEDIEKMGINKKLSLFIEHFNNEIKLPLLNNATPDSIYVGIINSPISLK